MRKFKEENSFAARLAESQSMKIKFPDRIPVILEAEGKCEKMDKIKFLIPEELQLATFILVVRKRLDIKHENALYFYIDGKLPVMNGKSMREIYEEHQDDDGFLYLIYNLESAFG